MNETVLVIDDNPVDRRVVLRELRGVYRVLEAATVAEAEAIIADEDIACVVLDLSLPDVDGLTFLDRLRSRTGELPMAVVMLTGHGSEGLAVQAMRSGVDDYLSKHELDGERLALAIRGALERRALHRKAGAALRRGGPAAGTRLLDRGMILDQLARLSTRTMAKGEPICAALVRMGADDERGPVADMGELVDHLVGGLAPSYLVGRLNARSVLVVATDCSGADTAERLAAQLAAALRAEGAGHAGVATVRGGGPEELLVLCASALNDATTLPDRVAVRASTAHGVKYDVTASELRTAIASEQLELRYQPLVDLNDTSIADFEVLVRWAHPRHGLLPPERFIRMAEERGLIADLGRWVVRTACTHAARWLDGGSVHHRVWVNLAAQHLAAPDCRESILTALEASGLPGRGLGLELTESAMLSASAAPSVGALLEELRGQDIAIALDDFGTGFSSLASMSELPIDELKFDRALTRRAGAGPRASAVIASMAELAHGLGIRVVAEGIETEDELEAVRAANCDLGQGYLFGRPLEPARADELVLAASSCSGRGA